MAYYTGPSQAHSIDGPYDHLELWPYYDLHDTEIGVMVGAAGSVATTRVPG